jgi:hypothetical protein
MKRLIHNIRIKLGLYDLRKEGVKWVTKNIGEDYVEEFLTKYDDINRGIPIGGMAETIVFLDMIERIKKDKNAYKNYELDKNKNMYVWRMNDNRKVKRIIFKLKPEDTSKLLPHQRLLRYKDDTYIMDDDFHYSVVTIDNTPYLIFTCPTTNISRRIDTIHYENE